MYRLVSELLEEWMFVVLCVPAVLHVKCVVGAREGRQRAAAPRHARAAHAAFPFLLALRF